MVTYGYIPHTECERVSVLHGSVWPSMLSFFEGFLGWSNPISHLQCVLSKPRLALDASWASAGHRHHAKPSGVSRVNMFGHIRPQMILRSLATLLQPSGLQTETSGLF